MCALIMFLIIGIQLNLGTVYWVAYGIYFLARAISFSYRVYKHLEG